MRPETSWKDKTRQPSRTVVGYCPACWRVVAVENEYETWPLVHCACGWVGDTLEVVNRMRFERGKGQIVRLEETFRWRDAELRLLDHWYNRTAENERAVEVPIVQEWLAHVDPLAGMRGIRGLEVGNVLGRYGLHGHRVVDLYEVEPGVENLDVMDVGGEYDWVVSVSTLEHVRCEEGPHPTASLDAVRHLRGLLAPGGKMLVTVPFGQQPYLDADILDGTLCPDEAGTMEWSGESWLYHDFACWRPARENGWANAVWVATWIKEN